MAFGKKTLRQAGPTEPCESCGTPVRVAQYDGPPRLNEVSKTGHERPGGHTPENCRKARDSQR